jgi:6-phosphogluconate dehydrogenase
MQLGMIGLGKMGGNMVRRLRRHGLEVAAYDRDAELTDALAGETGAVACGSEAQLVAALAAPRTVWLMLPAGDITEQALAKLLTLLQPGDRLVDGANSNFHDSRRRAARCAEAGVGFVDAGVSGGVWGLAEGYCLMLGGEERDLAALRPVIEALAPAADRGWVHCGRAGAGHYAKMVHNGIEYGMMQAFAEGFALMKSREDLGLDVAAVAEAWRHGSVVRSWLLDLTAGFLAEDAELDGIAPIVPDSGEGRWTALESVEQGVPTPVMTLALMMRYATQGANDYPARLLAMMRNAFGGHAVLGAAKDDFGGRP